MKVSNQCIVPLVYKGRYLSTCQTQTSHGERYLVFSSGQNRILFCKITLLNLVINVHQEEVFSLLLLRRK